MTSEYVRLNRQEKLYGDKNMLYVQLEFLNILKSFENYKKLRSKEFTLKVALKSKVKETMAAMEKFMDLLPKTKLKLQKLEEKKKKEKKKELSQSLQDEINMVKAKITQLGRGT